MILMAAVPLVAAGVIAFNLPSREPSAPLPPPPAMAEDTGPSNMLAHCATAITAAKNAGYLPDSVSMASTEITSLDPAHKRDQCAANTGQAYFQITYDRTCDQGFEPRCSTLVSIIRARDGKILYVARQ